MNVSPLHYLDTETTQSVSLGTVYRQESTGRVWRYAENGGTEAAPGKLMVQDTHSTNYADLAPTATAAGANQITVTLGASAATADQFKDGFAVVQDVDGEGIAYWIEGNPAANASATLKLDLAEEVQVALTTSSDIDLVQNLYKDVDISAADQNDVPVGVFNVTVAADAFGMIQTWGPAAVWHDEADPVGDSLTIGSATVGQVEQADAADEPIIGVQGPFTGAVADYQLVYLKIER